jgi:hypothetical protein
MDEDRAPRRRLWPTFEERRHGVIANLGRRHPVWFSLCCAAWISFYGTRTYRNLTMGLVCGVLSFLLFVTLKFRALRREAANAQIAAQERGRHSSA